MNDIDFERLTDGELSPDEYRRLLASLDDEPDGWRQCALAFLEAQALTGELRGVRAALDLRHDHRASASPRRIDRRDQWTFLAAAASFLLALGIGIVGPRFLPLIQNGGSLVTNTMPPAERDNVPHETLRPIGNVQLVMDDAGGDSPRRQVPVYEVNSDLNRYFADERPALGPELIELLRQRGLRVDREQQYYPAPLEDGRQIIVPVEGYQITPVGRTY